MYCAAQPAYDHAICEGVWREAEGRRRGMRREKNRREEERVRS